ncbi:MAG: aldo/keto reductase [Gemmatimonadaceae bacterium]
MLGTVQLGLPYGRRRASPVMTKPDAFRILDAAWEMGVRAFDTAESYGVSSSRLRTWIDERDHCGGLEVVTKCAVGEERAQAALSRFEGTGNVVLLSHGFADTDEWSTVFAVAQRNGAGAGQSVYGADEVRRACALAGVDRVQAPANVLDSRALTSRGNAPVALDIRSVYLQGVLLDSPDHADIRAPGAGRVVRRLQTAAAEVGSDLAPLLIASVLQTMRVGDRVVIGVDEASQLDVLPIALDIPASTVSEFRAAILDVASDQAMELILDPRQWPVEGAA